MTTRWLQTRRALLAAAALIVFTPAAPAADWLKPGKLALKSAGPLAFGPGGVLFVGDPQAAAVYAVSTGDAKPAAAEPITVDGLDKKLAAALGVTPEDVRVVDVAADPASKRVYLSVARGKGPDASAVILQVMPKGELKELALDAVPSARAELRKPVAAGPKRQEAITGLEYANGKLYVAGLSNEEFASTLRVLAVPFDDKGAAAGVQIYHGAHGKYETASPVRTFTPVTIDGKEEILAAYTCTPLVRIPVEELKDGAKVKGTTVAELGNRNRPLDIVTYGKGGKSFALIANSARGVMKVALDGAEKVSAITTRVQGTAGLPYETLGELKGVEQLEKLGDAHAVLLVRDAAGLKLTTIELP